MNKTALQEFYDKYILDFYSFSENFLMIEAKGGRLVPFVPRPYQRRIIDPILKAFINKEPVRLLICKGRQMGISTTVAAVFFWLMVTNHHMKGKLIADQSKRTDEVFGIYKRFLANLHPDLIPMIEADNTREVMFQNPSRDKIKDDPGLDSGMKAETAKDPNAGRAGTATLAHETEHAYFDYASKIDEGLGNSIPLMDGTFSAVVKETTSNGMDGKGGAFYSAWCEADAGESNSVPIFISWTENPEYEWNSDGFKPNELERKMMETHSELTPRKLMWRRNKLREYSKDAGETSGSIYTPEERFRQDYPLSAEESFLSSGNPVFDQDRLKSQIEFLRANPVVKFDVLHFFKDTLLEQYGTCLEVYDIPKDGTPYAIGADIAEGLEHGDASTAFVLDKNLNQVASFYGKIDPDLFGVLLVALGKLYNNALLAPEINNMGYATLSAIKNANYWNVYERDVRDERTEEIKKKIGWRTTTKNKLDMLAYFQARHRDSEVVIRDALLLKEMRGITRDATGNVSLNGKDRVVAACIALQAIKQATLQQFETQTHNSKGWF
jgi:hypothetical protein